MCFCNIEWTILRKRNQNIKIPASSRQSLKNHPNQKWMHRFLLYTFSSGKKSWRHTASSALLGGQVWCAQSPQPSSPPSTGNWANFRHPLRSDPAEKWDGFFLSSNVQCFACHLCAGINFHHRFWNDPRFGCKGSFLATQHRTNRFDTVSISIAPLIRINAYGLEKGVIPSDWEYDKRRFMVNWALLSCSTQTNQLEILTKRTLWLLNILEISEFSETNQLHYLWISFPRSNAFFGIHRCSTWILVSCALRPWVRQNGGRKSLCCWLSFSPAWSRFAFLLMTKTPCCPPPVQKPPSIPNITRNLTKKRCKITKNPWMIDLWFIYIRSTTQMYPPTN